MGFVCVRGAITVNNNTKEEIYSATKVMLNEILKENEINIDNIISINFSMTKDLDAAYPAVAAREIGITKAALMCFAELYVEGSLAKCIRVGVLVEQEGLTRDNVQNVYLGNAKVLRPDLVKEK